MKVPTPKKMTSGNWYINMRLGGESINVTEPTERACIRAAQLIKAEYLAGKREAKKAPLTLGDAIDKYIELRKPIRSPTTIDGYEKIRRNNFQSIMGIPIDKISKKDIDLAISLESMKPGQKKGSKMSPKTIENAYHLVSSALKENGINLDTPSVMPENKKRPVYIHRPEEIYSLVKGTEIELPCLLAMWLSFSISEIRGFTKSKSIHNGQISVVETVVDIKGEVVRKPLGKEEERSRTVNIPLYIQNLIDQVDGDIICPLTSQAVNKRFQRLQKKAGLTPMSFHKLRHVFASSAAALGIPPAYIQAMGGWKTDHIMRTVYTHTFTKERLEADQKIDAHFEQIIGLSAEKAN